MHLARTLLLTALVMALASCPLDCSYVMSPNQAMQCCKSMPCPRGKNCCKVRTIAQPPYVQVAAPKPGQLSVIRAAIIAAQMVRPTQRRTFRPFFASSHAPPGAISPTSLAPLRI
jgi:hypothetical protein